MRILVTGGAGFIGSHLTDRLLGEGHHVVCLDNFFTGRRANIEHILDHPGFELLHHDVCEPFFTEVDQIYNLACPASPVHYQYNPVKTVKSNVMGTLNMLVLAKRVNARILQASTSEVYGDPTVHPQSESYWGNVNPIGPRACYDEGKRVAETLMSDYHREDGVDIRIARIFNTYGPRMAENDGRVVSNFIVQALRGQELTLYGTGGQTRSFCYVDDLVDGLVRLMNADARHEPVNLGNPVEFTIRELAEEVAKVVGKDVQVTYRPLPQDDPTQRKPDITRARQWLGWEPTVPLAEGLVRTVEYFRRRLARRNRATAARLDPSEDLPSRQEGPI
ncbi:MAG TPA: UDP-glucuronic acid decarboxylase family protein [Gemmatimonadales bacterium]|nr:UDP-glucuronic acid decarboxylase family protein [Gemmatimonadales bacterium]